MLGSFQNEVPKARINIKLGLHIGGGQKKVELPLQSMVMGDYSNGQEQRPLSEREKFNINNADEQREEVRVALASQVPAFGKPPGFPVVAAAGRSHRGRRAVWPWWLLGGGLLASLWWCPDFYLRLFVHQVLP